MAQLTDRLHQLLTENALDEEAFAYCLGIEPAQAVALCNGRKKLTATLARQIEQTFSKPVYWLETDAVEQGPSYDLFGADS
ncbi:hypothetical protein [Saccharospirillum sp. MSK14-1]|uniref:hypothetical protein n=1 Tax=Saccharospirillum sp. MSK14-1 TaxID=1897632 RepID=UPI0011B1D06A|nr:hypothetical protein [Saccharospirillum sp. MSK14-1]